MKIKHLQCVSIFLGVFALITVALTFALSLIFPSTAISPVKDAFSTTQSLLTCIVIFAGAFWYFQRRKILPRANLIQEVTHWEVTGEKTLVRVSVTVENVGDVVVTIKSGYSRIQQVNPLQDDFLEETIKKSDGYLEGESTVINWPLIRESLLKGKPGFREIEPGEKDEYLFDFIIGNIDQIKLIQVYTELENEGKRRTPKRISPIAWHKNTLYQLG